MRLPDQDAGRVVRVRDLPPATDHVVHLGAVAVVDLPLARQPDHPVVVVPRGRVVSQQGVLDDHVHDVDPEAGHATVEPEAQDPVELVAHLLVPPVEVGLVGEEVVQVVLARRPVERPGGAAEAALPVVGRRPVRLRIGPHVPVALRVVP